MAKNEAPYSTMNVRHRQHAHTKPFRRRLGYEPSEKRKYRSFFQRGKSRRSSILFAFFVAAFLLYLTGLYVQISSFIVNESRLWKTLMGRGSPFEDTNLEWAIFYNVFIPLDRGDEGIQHVLRIVEEQMDQVGVSYASSIPSKPVTLYYATIGMEDALNATYMHYLCSVRNNFRCQHLNHYAEGHEEKTLQHLWNFCRAYKDKKVIYIHTKGTFHTSFTGQDRWRRHCTMAATSQACLQPANNSCNTCGLLMQPLPAVHIPGNFWVSDCSYVQKLVAPNTLHTHMCEILLVYKSLEQKGVFQNNLFNLDAQFFGRVRFASEHWIGSHPAMVPCDLSITANMSYWMYGADRTLQEFDFAMAPRHDMNAPWTYFEYVKQFQNVTSNPELLEREWYLLSGLLYKWFLLYNVMPDSSSWVWEWFPNGQGWRQKIEKYGSRALESFAKGSVR